MKNKDIDIEPSKKIDTINLFGVECNFDVLAFEKKTEQTSKYMIKS